MVLSALEVLKCGKCDELVFTYDTEEQVNNAYRALTDARRNGTSPACSAEEKVKSSGQQGTQERCGKSSTTS